MLVITPGLSARNKKIAAQAPGNQCLCGEKWNFPEKSTSENILEFYYTCSTVLVSIPNSSVILQRTMNASTRPTCFILLRTSPGSSRLITVRTITISPCGHWGGKHLTRYFGSIQIHCNKYLTNLHSSYRLLLYALQFLPR